MFSKTNGFVLCLEILEKQQGATHVITRYGAVFRKGNKLELEVITQIHKRNMLLA